MFQKIFSYTFGDSSKNILIVFKCSTTKSRLMPHTTLFTLKHLLSNVIQKAIISVNTNCKEPDQRFGEDKNNPIKKTYGSAFQTRNSWRKS